MATSTLQTSHPDAASAHDAAWESLFVKPIAQTMQQRGIAYLVICIQDGKAKYVLDTDAPDAATVDALIHPQDQQLSISATAQS